MITLEQFDKYIDRMKYKPKQKDLLDALNIAMEEAEINTPLRTAAFMSQVTHETGAFKYFVEFGSIAYFNKYQGRSDLGNIYPGDGYRFRGRGFIQVTGRYNYTKCGSALGLDLVKNPDMAAELITGARIAGWYWKTRGLNTPSDAGDIYRVTKLINGGYNGIDDRKKWYEKCKEVLFARDIEEVKDTPPVVHVAEVKPVILKSSRRKIVPAAESEAVYSTGEILPLVIPVTDVPEEILSAPTPSETWGAVETTDV